MPPKIGGNNPPLPVAPGQLPDPATQPTASLPKKESTSAHANPIDSFENTITEEVPIHIAKGREVVKAFDTQVEKILHRDAMSLAQGHTPVYKPEDLTDGQEKAVLDATTDLLMDLPMGAMSPSMAAKAQQTIKKLTGKDPGDLTNTSLRELSDVGEKTAKALAADWRENSPVSFYATAATVVAGVAYYGYAKGSKALDKIGLKPELKKTFLDNHLEVKARFDWDEEFANFRLSEGSLTARADIDEHHKLHTTLKLGGFDEIKSLGAGYKFRDDKTNISLGVDHNYRESRTVLSGSLSERINPALTLGMSGTYDFKDDRPTMSFTGKYKPDTNFYLSAGLTVDALDHRATGTLRGEYEVRENMNLALSGSFDSEGESRIGLGFTLKF